MVTSEFQYCKLSITNWGGPFLSQREYLAMFGVTSIVTTWEMVHLWAEKPEMLLNMTQGTGQSPIPKNCLILQYMLNQGPCSSSTSMSLILPTRLQGCQGTKLIRSFRRLLIFLLHYCGSNPSSASSWTCDCMCVWDFGQITSCSVSPFPGL